MCVTGKKWSALNDDPARPLYNRFRQVWAPGSSFKPIIAAIGVESGAIDPYEDFGSEGLRWQKDQSWGDYEVTTLRAYSPATLENAIVYSDNIYFALRMAIIPYHEIKPIIFKRMSQIASQNEAK